MSKNKLIALAIAAALAAPVAYAVEVDLPANETVVPTNAIVDETVAVTVGSAIEITAGPSDSYLARTTGYSVVVTLDNGATFAQAVTDGDITLIGNTATATIAGGGGVGQSSVTVSVTPGAAVEENDGFAFNAGSFVVDNVEFLADGAPLTIDVLVRDPGTGFTLETTDDTTLVTAIQGWEGEFLAGDQKSAWWSVAMISQRSNASFRLPTASSCRATPPAVLRTTRSPSVPIRTALPWRTMSLSPMWRPRRTSASWLTATK